MEQGRKEKVPVPAEVWAVAAVEKEKVAVRDAARDKAVDAARGKAKVKVAVKPEGRAANRISRPPLEELSDPKRSRAAEGVVVYVVPIPSVSEEVRFTTREWTLDTMAFDCLIPECPNSDR